MTLKDKAVTGLFWTFSQQFGTQIANFIIQVLLARLLMPEEFGVIAILNVFIGIGGALMDSGLTSSLIRSTDADEKDYSTVFFMNLIGSVIIYFLVFITAPFISSFFNMDRLVLLVRIYSLSFIIQAFASVQTTRLTKAMNFKLQLYMQLPSVIIGGVFGLLMAYYGFGIWSLVCLGLVQSFVFAVQHWYWTGWSPILYIDKNRLVKHFLFGYKLALSGLLDTLYRNFYSIIIGKAFSSAELGYYNRAETLNRFPVKNLSTALYKVSYPLFSSIQDNDKKLKEGYKIIMQQVAFWVTPLMIILALSAEPLFRIVLTEKWLPAVPYFQVLCISGVLYPLQVYNLNILNVKGRSDLYLKLEIIKKVLIVIGTFCVIPFGIYGLLYFQAFISLINFYINSFYSGRLLNYSIKEQIKDLLPTFILAPFVGCILWGCDLLMVRYFQWTDIMRVSGIAFLYLALYLSISYMIKMNTINDFKKLVLKR